MKEMITRERNTAWKEVLKSFFISDAKQEKEENKEFTEWERENKEYLSKVDKNVGNLVQMLEQHIDEDKKPKKGKGLKSMERGNTIPKTSKVLNNEKIENQEELEK